MTNRNTAPRIERRDASGEAPQVTDSGLIHGLAIPFDSWTTIGSGPLRFRERVSSGAVTKTLNESDVVYLDNHDAAKPVARTSAGTLTLTPSARGVVYDALPADTSYARDLVTNIKAGNIRGNSFGFEVVKDKWVVGEDGVDERTLLEIKLPEISACTFPAYLDTEIGMRDAYAVAMEARDAYYQRDGSQPYGNVAYADPGYQADKKKRYPVDTKKHVKAAWSYINKAKNAAKYTADQLAKIKAKIKAAAAKVGVKISSDRSFANFSLRNYDPCEGFVTEISDESESRAQLNPGGQRDVVAQAIDRLAAGDHSGAQTILQNYLDGTDCDGGDYDTEDSQGMLAHTAQNGSVVVLPRSVERVYELVRSLPATAASNEALKLLEPLLTGTPAEEERGDPKPETSTSGIEIDSEQGLDLQRRMRALKDSFRP